MNKSLAKQEVEDLIAGAWHGYSATGAGGVSEDYYTFGRNGRWSHSDSMSNTVRNAGILSGYSSSSGSGRTCYITDAGELVLQYSNGQEWKPAFEVSKFGNDIRVGNI